MDTLKGIEILAKKTHEQEVPVLGVAEDVITRLNAGPAPLSFVAFDAFASLCATAASILMYIGINAWTYVMNPLTQFFSPLQEVRLW